MGKYRRSPLTGRPLDTPGKRFAADLGDALGKKLAEGMDVAMEAAWRGLKRVFNRVVKSRHQK